MNVEHCYATFDITLWNVLTNNIPENKSMNIQYMHIDIVFCTLPHNERMIAMICF